MPREKLHRVLSGFFECGQCAGCGDQLPQVKQWLQARGLGVLCPQRSEGGNRVCGESGKMWKLYQVSRRDSGLHNSCTNAPKHGRFAPNGTFLPECKLLISSS